MAHGDFIFLQDVILTALLYILGGMNPEMVAFMGQVTGLRVCSKSAGPLNSPLCQGETGKVIRIKIGREGCRSSLYSQKVWKSGAGSLTSPNHPAPSRNPGASQKACSVLYKLDGIHYFLAYVVEVTHPYSGVNSVSISSIKNLEIIISYCCNTRNFRNNSIRKTKLGTILGYNLSQTRMKWQFHQEVSRRDIILCWE